MLTLIRRTGESIMIGDDIEIIVQSITNKQVRLRIAAPRKITVDRKEIYLQKKKSIDRSIPKKQQSITLPAPVSKPLYSYGMLT